VGVEVNCAVEDEEEEVPVTEEKEDKFQIYT
jgi:hypothetical protein